jgi:ABC-type lipoprotein export system ATPase subunit
MKGLKMLLKLENIFKGYGNLQYENYQPVLKDISLEVEEGESIAIIGPSGSGKTTLLNMIGTLDRPDAGKILYRNKDITGLSRKEIEKFRNKEIGIIFQMHYLLPQCTLFENVLLPTLPDKNDRNSHERAEKLIRRVGLWEHKDKKPQLLSGGECQRTAVVRALINNPGLLLADEPTGALDHENAVQLTDLLLEINRDDKLTLIMVTHSQEMAEKMKKIFRLRDGMLEMIN